MVPLWMFPIALACGNTFILKPSEKDPSASIRMAELLKEAGLPDGVFNVVHGDKEAVDAMLHTPTSRRCRLSARRRWPSTSTPTAAANGKRVQALGGAKNHAVVLPDADLDFTADALIGARTARPASAAWRSRRWSPSATPATARREAGREGADAQGRPRHARRHGHGAARHRRPSRQGEGYVDAGVEAGATLVVDGRGLKVPGYETASSSGRRSSTTSRPR